MEEAKRTYVCFVLDESGSMGACRNEAISGFNEQVKVVRENAKDGGETTISLFKFGSGDHADYRPVQVYFNKPPTDLLELSAETYQPTGMTPMYDGVGKALSALETLPKDGNTAFLVIVISDGLENYSKEWTAGKIAQKIKGLQESGQWTFVYIGANQDLSDVQKHLGIDPANMAGYQSDSMGTAHAFRATASNVGSYFCRERAAGMTMSASFHRVRPESGPVAPTPPSAQAPKAADSQWTTDKDSAKKVLQR